MVSVPIIKKRTKPFKLVPPLATQIIMYSRRGSSQAPPVGSLQECKGGMEEAKGYRQQGPQAVQGPSCHAQDRLW